MVVTMSKHKRRKQVTPPNPPPIHRHRQTRDFNTIARRRRDYPRRAGVLQSTIKRLVEPSPLTHLREVEDLRSTKHVRKGRFVRNDGTPAGTRYKPVHDRVYGLFQGMHLSFSEPQKTAVCIRRKSRRRVLFALQKAGKGKRPTRRARWTSKSYIRCK